jgi:uncharacterized repeat protein (TIGR01451 family)
MPSCRVAFEYARKSLNIIALGLTLLTALATVTHATEAVELHTELVAEVRVSSNAPTRAPGSTQERQTYRMVPAKLLSQGQVVYYTLRITNPTPVVANNVTVVQQVPSNTRYLPGSAVGPGADIEFSIDGGRTFARAEDLKLEDGSSRAPPERYTHILWRLRNPLAPGALALARFRATFN